MRKEQIPLIDRADYLHHRHQIITVGGVTMALFATGNILGFSSFTIPELLSSESKIKATQDDLSWIASLVTVGCIVGSLFGGISSDLIGRRRTILFASLIFSGGWIAIARSKTVGQILIGRMITGIASGLCSSSVQVYICEIVDPSIRGASGSIPSLMVSIGILSIYCLGGVTHWRNVAYICSTFPILVFLYMLLLPESPVWLVSKGYTTDALKALTWLRNDDNVAEHEYLRLEYLKERRNANVIYQTTCSKYCSRFFESSVLKPLGIGIGLFFFQQFSGIFPITFYMQLIFAFADNFINDSLETISIGFIRMFVTFIAIFLVKFLSRRLLLITSGLLMSISTGILGGYFYYREITVIDYIHNKTIGSTFENITDPIMITTNYSSSVPSAFSPLAAEITIQIHNVSIEWIPLVCLLIFMFGYCIGFGVIPFFFIAECSAADVRSINSAICYAFSQICLFTAVKIFLDMLTILTSYGTFWLYSIVAFCGVIFVILFVPETFDLDSTEIEAIFENSIHLYHFNDGPSTSSTAAALNAVTSNNYSSMATTGPLPPAVIDALPPRLRQQRSTREGFKPSLQEFGHINEEDSDLDLTRD